MSEMFEKTKKIKKRFEELTEEVMKPEVIADNREWKKLVKERSKIEEISNAHDELSFLLQNLEKTQGELSLEKDNEIIEMFQEEINDLKGKIENKEEQVKLLLLPKDENDDNNVIIEIRSAAGGEESSLFCSVLTKMYSRYAEKHRFQIEIIDVSETELGGIKEITFMVKGKGAYSKLKYESGVHRVQRVPETESKGRVHTSTSTVAVLPEIEDVDFEILEKDLRVDTYRSSGAGGQHVNKTESAIRLTHIPTNIVVACQDERSQIKNKDKAMKVLKSKLYDYYKEQIDSQYKENRKSQVGTGDRSERIRTFNFPESRVTDHRVGVTSYNIESVLDGDIDEFIEALTIKDREEKLANA